MKPKPEKATRAEQEYVRDMSRASAFELLDRGRARVLTVEGYPEALQRFLRREARTVHVTLSAAAKRKLETRSRRLGVPLNSPANASSVRSLARPVKGDRSTVIMRSLDRRDLSAKIPYGRVVSHFE